MALAALPNALSLLRLIITPLLPLVYACAPRPEADWIVLGLFVVAMATDFFDGWLARRFELHSDFGRMIDPIADKAAVLSALFLWAAVWQIDRPGAPLDLAVFGAAVLILLRELFVSGLREHLGGIALKVSKLGKLKTVAQAVALSGLFLDQALRAEGAHWAGLTQSGLILLWIAVLLTLWTGAEYARAAWAEMQRRARR